MAIACATVLADFAPNGQPDTIRGILIAFGAFALGLWLIRPVALAIARRRVTDEQLAELKERNGPLRDLHRVSRAGGWLLVALGLIGLVHAIF